MLRRPPPVGQRYAQQRPGGDDVDRLLETNEGQRPAAVVGGVAAGGVVRSGCGPSAAIDQAPGPLASRFSGVPQVTACCACAVAATHDPASKDALTTKGMESFMGPPSVKKLLIGSYFYTAVS